MPWIGALIAAAGLALAAQSPAAEPAPSRPWSGFASCRSSDPSWICLALRYVVYRDTGGNPLADRVAADRNVATINSVWRKCGIGFEVEEYVDVDPASRDLRFRTASYPDLTHARRAFETPSMLLLVTTGKWDRTGQLGRSGANSWTSMPGSPPYGAILEEPVARNANLIAHELGHYLNLTHETNDLNLMNPVIYSRSVGLSEQQCAAARATATGSWQAMLRRSDPDSGAQVAGRLASQRSASVRRGSRRS